MKLSSAPRRAPNVGAIIVVSPEPVCGVVLHLLDCCEHVLIQQLVPNGSVVAFDTDVLLRLTRLDVLDRNAAAVTKIDFHKCCTMTQKANWISAMPRFRDFALTA